MKTVTLICEGCGISFERSEKKYKESQKRGTRIMCTLECYRSHRKSFKKKPKIKINCEQCGCEFEKFESQLKLTNHHFCNEKCNQEWKKGKHVVDRIEVKCGTCGNKILKTPGEINWCNKINKNNKIFCSKKCWYNTKKKFTFIKKIIKRKKLKLLTNAKRSKLELYIEKKILDEFPLSGVSFTKLIKGHSIDIFFDKFKLAIEINGIIHHKPIYGLKKLQYVQNRDKEKLKICNDLNISLHIINVLETAEREQIMNKYWQQTRQIIVNAYSLYYGINIQ